VSYLNPNIIGISSFDGHDMVRYARSHASLNPIISSAGWGQEPAVSILNKVLAIIMGPPFAYPWNRYETQLLVPPATQDISLALPLPYYGGWFNFLEKATLNTLTGQVYSLSFNPAQQSGGSGYSSSDIGTTVNIMAGNNAAEVIITGVSGGAVTSIGPTPPAGFYGAGYSLGNQVPTGMSQSGGTGLTVQITLVAPQNFNKELSIRHRLDQDATQNAPDFICPINETINSEFPVGAVLALDPTPIVSGSGYTATPPFNLKIVGGNNGAYVHVLTLSGTGIGTINTVPYGSFYGSGYSVGTYPTSPGWGGSGCEVAVLQVQTLQEEISFRLFPSTDQYYVLDLLLQSSPPVITDLSTTLDPVPDRYIHIIYQGFLAQCYEIVGDPRADVAMDLFLRQLISAQTCLSDAERNMFQSERLLTLSDIQRVSNLRNLGMGLQTPVVRG
jgi:hypothetical protein